jgi:hypothetical protein
MERGIGSRTIRSSRGRILDSWDTLNTFHVNARERPKQMERSYGEVGLMLWDKSKSSYILAIPLYQC